MDSQNITEISHNPKSTIDTLDTEGVGEGEELREQELGQAEGGDTAVEERREETAEELVPEVQSEYLQLGLEEGYVHVVYLVLMPLFFYCSLCSILIHQYLYFHYSFYFVSFHSYLYIF